jgi:predicted O-methyltransferase YrrM
MDPKTEAFLDELYAFGQREGHMMNVPPETGRFLRMLVIVTRATRIAEIGTSNGYSAIWLALGAKITNGQVATLENDPKKVIMARKNFVQAGVSRLIELWQGEATIMLKRHGQLFDLAFIDGAKEEYLQYYKTLIPKIRVGGLIVADNAVSHADQMRDFLEAVADDPRVESLLIGIGSGLLLIYRVE